MPEIEKVTWLIDASAQYEATKDGAGMTDVHEFDQIEHVFVVYDDGTTQEWSLDWGKPMPQWATEAWEWGIAQLEATRA